MRITATAGWRGRTAGIAWPRSRRLVAAAQLLYAVLFSALLIYTHSWPAPDLIALFLLLFALLSAQGIAFLRDWTPFVVLLLGYIGLTGIVGGLEARAHVQFPIGADRMLFFGHVPTLWLQAHFWNAGHARWYDYVATFLYPMHFVVPLVFAFVLWTWRKPLYWKFVGSYLLLSYAGFITYLLFPMAPPWWAYRVGQLPPVHLILYEVHYGGVSNPIVLATQLFHPNPVAAMPSLHAAFPVLVWLVAWRAWPRWGWALVIYVLAMGLSVVYLGEHYVVDVLAGWLYALVAFAAIWGGGRFWHSAGSTVRREHSPTAPDQRPRRRMHPSGTPAAVVVARRRAAVAVRAGGRRYAVRPGR